MAPRKTETVTPIKRGRGRPPGSKKGNGNGNGHDPLADAMDQTWAKHEVEGVDVRVDQNEELADPALFPELDTVRIPKLEKRARELAAQRDRAKQEKEKEDGLAEECYLIMSDHNIEVYDHGGVRLKIKRKPRIIVELD